VSDLREHLRAYAEAIPPGTPVPVPREWLLQLLGCSKVTSEKPAIAAPADMTVAELAARFRRRPSTVRGWIERGLFPGAYKFMGGREWRVPQAALEAFEAGQRAGRPQNRLWGQGGRPVDLGAWRRESETA
jgi:hypothetical protein